MVEYHGSTSAVVTGSSTHNECIERQWHDVHRSVTMLFYNSFYKLKSKSKLNPLYETDIYCLHYACINKCSLEIFCAHVEQSPPFHRTQPNSKSVVH